jgi:hypothetical protein
MGLDVRAEITLIPTGNGMGLGLYVQGSATSNGLARATGLFLSFGYLR